jgi:hypothetical protein
MNYEEVEHEHDLLVATIANLWCVFFSLYAHHRLDEILNQQTIWCNWV